MKLSKEKIEKLKTNITNGIQLAEQYYSDVREPRYIEAYDRYYANEEYQSRFGDLADKSKVVFRDIMNKIEWAMPSIIRLIAGQSDIVGIQGRTAEDDRSAEILKKLINWQLQRENEGFLIFYRFVKDVLKYSYAVIKVRWEREFEEKEFEIYVSSTDVEVLLKGTEGEKLGILQKYLKKRDKIYLRRVVEIKISNIKEEDGLYKAKIKIKRLKTNKPVLENLLPWEFLYIPDARTIDKVSFVAHKKRIKADYLLRKAKDKFFSNTAVKDALENADFEISELERLVKDSEESLSYYEYSDDENLKEIDLYEIYTKLDINNDGLLEDVIVWYAGGEILRIEENITGRHPFFGASAVIESEKLEGTSFNDLIGQYQDVKTALWKQLLINVAKNNDPITFVDPSYIDVDALAEGSKYIATDLEAVGDIRKVIQFEPATPLSPHILPALELLNGEEENSTGITRYNQGLDAKSLNKTATGISMIMQAANQRLELIVRIISEVALRPLFRYLVLLNQLYMDTETIVRLTNETLVVKPDDLFGEFDFVVDTSVGLGTKEVQMSAMQVVGQFYPQFIQMLQVFIQYPNFYEKFRNYYKKQLELIGIKAIDEYLPTIDEVQKIGQQAMMQAIQNKK